MKAWVLIIAICSGGCSVTTHEFGSEAACERAAALWRDRGGPIGPLYQAVCAPK